MDSSRPVGLLRRQSFEPSSTTSSSSSSSSASPSSSTWNNFGLGGSNSTSTTPASSSSGPSRLIKPSLVGKLPSPASHFNYHQFLASGQRSVPVFFENGTSSSLPFGSAFNTTPSALAASSSSSSSSITTPTGAIGSSSTNRSVSGPSFMHHNNDLDSPGQRTPGGSLAIGSEVFGFGSGASANASSAASTRIRSTSKEHTTPLAGVTSVWNDDLDGTIRGSRPSSSAGVLNLHRPSTPSGGWPSEFEPPVTTRRLIDDDEVIASHKNGPFPLHRSSSRMSPPVTSRPLIKHTGSSIDLRSSVFSSTQPFDGHASTPTDSVASSAFSNSRPSIPRSKSGLPSYGTLSGQNSLASSNNIGITRPSDEQSDSKRDSINSNGNGSSTPSKTSNANIMVAGGTSHINNTHNEGCLSTGYPTTDGWATAESNPTATSRPQDNNLANSSLSGSKVTPAFQSPAPSKGVDANSISTFSSFSPDGLSQGFQHMSIQGGITHSSGGRASSIGTPVNAGNLETTNQFSKPQQQPQQFLNMATPYGATLPSNSYSNNNHSGYIPIPDIYYAQHDPTYYALQNQVGTDPSRKENYTLPLPWGMPSASDYSPSSTGATPTRQGSFSMPYSPAVSPQPGPHYNLAALNSYGATPYATFDLQKQQQHHLATGFAANGFQPAQQHQIILGRQLRSNAEYIAPGPRGGVTTGPNGPILPPGFISGPLDGGSINGYHHQTPRPFGVGYGAGYGAGETMGKALRSQLLDEFRNSRHKHWELTNMTGHIVEFAGDQLGSRFIQTKLETATPDEKDLVFQEMLPNLLQLSTDVFANYVVQKFFEQGNQLQKSAMANVLEGHVLELSLQMYGCRVVQKAIEFLLLDQQVRLVKELESQVLRCAKDAQSNHVLQRAIERIPGDKITFITDACLGNVQQLASHAFGCRVLQRIFENCPPAQSRPLLEELHACSASLVQDQYGNYVIQWIIEKGETIDRSRVFQNIQGSVFHFSQQKYASNVVEKCLLNCTAEERRALIEEALTDQPDGSSTIRAMLVHPFANYVVQKMLAHSTGSQHDRLIAQITEQLESLRNYSGHYSKHLMTIEKLLEAERTRN